MPTDLTSIKTHILLAEIFNRGDVLREHINGMLNAQREIKTHTDAFREASAASTKCLSEIHASAKTEINALAESCRHDCRKIAQAIESTTQEKLSALEQTCLKRVAEAEALCQSTVERVTQECNDRAGAAENEALRCLDLVDQSAATANALGVSFNQLNERLHNLEISLRTLFAGGSSFTPAVYTPPTNTPPAPVPSAPTAPSAPESKPGPNGNGAHPPRMTFALVGLHRKDLAHLLQRLRIMVQRNTNLLIIENTSKDVLPRQTDYAVVGGDPDLTVRWKFCIQTLGSDRCVRLENNSLSAFRAKIEELYDLRYPLNTVATAFDAAAPRSEPQPNSK